MEYLINIYNSVLRLDLLDGVEATGYADNLVIALKSGTRDELMYRANDILWKINRWMNLKKLPWYPKTWKR